MCFDSFYIETIYTKEEKELQKRYSQIEEKAVNRCPKQFVVKKTVILFFL